MRGSLVISDDGREILEDIIETLHPEEMDMENWWCGTTGCIAGHVVKRSRKGYKMQLFYPNSIREGWQLVAPDGKASGATVEYSMLRAMVAELGLPTSVIRTLTFVDEWPIVFSIDFMGSSSARKCERTKKRIQSFINRWVPEGPGGDYRATANMDGTFRIT